jgi:hypothetical protein
LLAAHFETNGSAEDSWAGYFKASTQGNQAYAARFEANANADACAGGFEASAAVARGGQFIAHGIDTAYGGLFKGAAGENGVAFAGHFAVEASKGAGSSYAGYFVAPVVENSFAGYFDGEVYVNAVGSAGAAYAGRFMAHLTPGYTTEPDAAAYGGHFRATAGANLRAYAGYFTVDEPSGDAGRSYAGYFHAPANANSFAGYFDGNVHVEGNLTATGLNKFLIDHPVAPYD